MKTQIRKKMKTDTPNGIAKTIVKTVRATLIACRLTRVTEIYRNPESTAGGEAHLPIARRHGR